MHKKRQITLRFLVVTGLLATAGLILFLSGIGVRYTLFSMCLLAFLLWFFTRKPRPKDEIDVASVSCCHYLQDHEEESP